MHLRVRLRVCAHVQSQAELVCTSSALESLHLFTGIFCLCECTHTPFYESRRGQLRVSRLQLGFESGPGALQSMHDSVVDFPFRVSPAEQEIIELDPQPPCPMLLVGRSGTGACIHVSIHSSSTASWACWIVVHLVLEACCCFCDAGNSLALPEAVVELKQRDWEWGGLEVHGEINPGKAISMVTKIAVCQAMQWSVWVACVQEHAHACIIG